jgi:HD-GYP domain-containing protein (c-di-GMP phosphodiesterase class II)
MTGTRSRGDGIGAGAPALPRRAELLAALSLAIDLGLGQPMEHMLRSCVLGRRLGEALGLEPDVQDRVFYSTLLAWIGCHADSFELAGVFGDDIAFRAATYAIDMRGFGLAAMLLGRVGSTSPAAVRAARAVGFLAAGRRVLTQLMRSHCVSAGTLARQAGLDDKTCQVLRYAFERWDGGGLPTGAAGDAIPLEMRIGQLTDTVEVHLRQKGQAAAVDMVRRRRGTQFDPGLADFFCDHASQLLEGLLHEDAWAAALRSAPVDRVRDTEELDSMLTALGDFVDLKSPYTAGHSRAVAVLAEDAARVSGFGTEGSAQLRRAGLVHDLGRMGVSNAVWDKAAPLSTSELERVRMHPYLTERILSRIDGLAPVARLAGAHHERVDGSGYPSGTDAQALTAAQRILAAADSYCTWTEPRPHRPRMSREEAAARLRHEVSAFRLDRAAVHAVLQAAGHETRRRREGPGGLTSRELEVLQLVIRGLSSRQVAEQLVISEKTARHHIEHIYTKLGVTNRISATLFALQHGLVGDPDLR